MATDSLLDSCLNISRKIEEILKKPDTEGLMELLTERGIYLKAPGALKDNGHTPYPAEKLEAIQEQDQIILSMVKNRLDSLGEKLHDIRRGRNVIKKYAPPALPRCPRYIEIWK